MICGTNVGLVARCGTMPHARFTGTSNCDKFLHATCAQNSALLDYEGPQSRNQPLLCFDHHPIHGKQRSLEIEEYRKDKEHQRRQTRKI